MHVRPLIGSLIGLLFTSVSVLATEPTASKPSHIFIKAGPWSGTSLDEFLETMLDYADKVTQSHSRRNVRPSDRLFDSAVMRHLTSLSSTREERLPKLVELLASQDSRIRYVALTLIHRDWPIATRIPVSLLQDNAALQTRVAELLRDELWETADAAAQRLAVVHQRNWPPELTDHVLMQLKGDRDAQVRAARLVRAAANPPAEAEALLLAAVQRQPEGVAQHELAWALFHYGKVPAEAVPVFIGAVRSSAQSQRPSGGMCCVPHSPLNASRAAAERQEIQIILASLGPDAAPAIPALIELLADEDLETRRVAVLTLGKFGPLAKAALPRLMTMNTKSQHVGATYSRQVGMFGQSYVLPARIDTEVTQAYARIAGRPMSLLFQLGQVTDVFDLARGLSVGLTSLDACCPGFHDVIRLQPEYRQAAAMFAVLASLVSPRLEE